MDDAAPNPNCPGCQALLKRVERLERKIAGLEALLGRDSSNSNRPPSSDLPSQRAERPARPPSGKKPGGQPGHQACQRALLPDEQVTRREHRAPRRCRRCAASLADAEEIAPLRHQVVEIPRIAPDVTEYVLGRRRCAICQTVTAARFPQGTPRGMCGPRLMGLIALLTGAYHLSRRTTATLLGDVLGVKLSLGTVSNVESHVSDALAPAHAEALARVRQAKVKNLDATSWAQAGEPRSLWTFASRLATVFVITLGATTDVVRELVGTVRGTLVTDRGSQFGFWAMDRRQICWAHLVRKFVAFTQSPRQEVQTLGEALLLLSQAHLACWHRVRDGTETRQGLQALIARLEPIFLGHLERAVGLRLSGVSGVCANLLAHKDALFTYAFVDGVPTTNNHAERELRSFVLWRKQTAGTRSERGDRYAERVMTVVHTLRKQGRHVLSFLELACANSLRTEPLSAVRLLTP
jgi:transposase